MDMNKREILVRAFDTFDSNAFVTTGAYATAINPKVWDTDVRAYEEANLVYSKIGVSQYDFRMPGRDLTITVDGAPTVAGQLTETDGITVQAITNRQVVFTPVEYGIKFEVSKSEVEDTFLSVIGNMTKKAGYSLALKKDAVGMAAAIAGATTKLVCNDVASSAIATSDTLGLEDFSRAVRVIKNYYYKPIEAFINPSQEEQVLNISQVQKANEFGTRSAIESGLIGQLFGLKIYVTHSVATSNNKAKMVVQGLSGSGEKAVGYAVKRDPTLEIVYNAEKRKYDVIATERYGFNVLHPNAIVTVESYAV